MTENAPREPVIVITTAATVRDEMAEAVAEKLRRPNEKLKSLYGRIADALTCRRTGYVVTARQIRMLHHREWREVPGHLVDNVRALVAHVEAAAREAQRKAIAEAVATEINDIQALKRELEQMREKLDALDPDFHEPSTQALREMVSQPLQDAERRRKMGG